MNFVGKLDIEMYKCITENITTDEVIITNERIEHIIERRGQKFYDTYSPMFAEIIVNPDYIFKDKMKNTALVAKTINQNNRSINIVIRLVTENDNPDFKNSIITAMPEGNRRFQQRLRNNTPLYKRVDTNE